MRKALFTAFVFLLFLPLLKAQTATPYELAVGLRVQKTEQLYWENGVAADFTSDFLLQKIGRASCRERVLRLV